jgi:hypothetical protein
VGNFIIQRHLDCLLMCNIGVFRSRRGYPRRTQMSQAETAKLRCASPKSRMSRLRFPVTTFKGWALAGECSVAWLPSGLLAVSRAESHAHLQRPQLDHWECPYRVRGGSDLRDSSGCNVSSTSSNASGSEQSRGPVGLDARFPPSAPRCRSATDFARRFAGAASHSPPPSPPHQR